MMRMPFPLTGSSIKRELAGNTTSTDPRSRRIRESRKGRPCNELGLSAHCLSTACPHLRAPGAPRPRWAHHNAVLRKAQPDEKGSADYILDNGIVERFHNGIVERFHNGIVERFHKTMLDEFYRIAFRKKIYNTISELQNDLDAWMAEYNEERNHQGRYCFGKTPMQTFSDARAMAQEKQIGEQRLAYPRP
jgi:hypothetical protein